MTGEKMYCPFASVTAAGGPMAAAPSGEVTVIALRMMGAPFMSFSWTTTGAAAASTFTDWVSPDRIEKPVGTQLPVWHTSWEPHGVPSVAGAMVSTHACEPVEHELT